MSSRRVPSLINLSIHRDNLKYIKGTDLEKAHPSIVHTNLAWRRLKEAHEKTTIINKMLLRRERISTRTVHVLTVVVVMAVAVMVAVVAAIKSTMRIRTIATSKTICSRSKKSHAPWTSTRMIPFTFWELVDDEKEAYLTVMEATLPPTPTPLATNWKPDYKLTQSVDDLDAELEYVFNHMDLAAACSDDQANHVNSAAPSHLQGPSLIMDSGASSHMTGDLSLLHDVKECRRSVNLADGHTISVKAMGQLRVQSNTTGKTAVFQETLHVPTLRKTPLSISQLTRENPHAQVVFHGNTMDIMIGPDVSIQAATTNSLYELDASVLLPSTPDVGSVYLVAIEATSIWHARLGYPPAASTQAILKATHGGPSQLLHPD
ncbi:hypothetical protein DYB37_013963, partial [Aphanomyces astaci]